MGVAPPVSAGGFGASPPTPLHGGNFDLQELCRGGTLFLPVNVKGAYFYVGNGHALQGNGEITNPSLEVSLTGYFKFIVHKGKALKIPDDLQAAIDAVPKAKEMLGKLSEQNRFALAFRTHNMKTEAGRKKKIATFVQMLRRGETIYPQGKKRVSR